MLLEGMQLSGEGTTYTKATLAYARARVGDTSYGEQVLRELEDKRTHDYVSPVELATVNIALGDIDRALDWAEEAVPERRGWLAYLKVNPIMDPLRGQPRFDALVEKMGLAR